MVIIFVVASCGPLVLSGAPPYIYLIGHGSPNFLKPMKMDGKAFLRITATKRRSVKQKIVEKN